MTHLDARTLDTVVADVARAKRKTLLHVDGCFACRRAFGERGGRQAELAARLAATRPRGAVVAATAFAVLATAAATIAPFRAATASMLATFEPHHVTAVPLTLDEMRSLRALPDLSAYAATRELVRSSNASFSDVRAASTAAQFTIREPSAAIPGLKPVSYSVQSASAQLMTFKRSNWARLPQRAVGGTLPADIAGTTLRIDLRPAVVAMYDTAAAAADRERLENAFRRSAPAMYDRPHERRSAPAAARPQQSEDHASTFVIVKGRGVAGTFSGLPLVVAQMPVPRIASTGASVQRLVSFMLTQPGVPPRVAAAFRALGDLSTTLPIPVPIDEAYTAPVAVDGVVGVGLGDDTGIGAAVVWQKNGMLYAVFAPRTAREVLAVADSLR